MKNKHTNKFIPIIIALSIILGISIGAFYTNHFSGTNQLGIINSNSNKLNALLRIIDDRYVDTVDMSNLIEDAMPEILSELDPHSTYIPAKFLAQVNSELEGSFSGIGVKFTLQKDTIYVNNVISGGPSEKVGLMPGDRIISVNDTAFVGKIVTQASAMKKLKGKKGTTVKIGVKRPSVKETLYFDIIRDDIPQKSVEASYIINDSIGYVQISKFARTTHVELLNSIALLTHKKCKGLIIDLRGNTGGYMEAAIRMVNEFLPEGQLIVYTEGRRHKRSNQFANGAGSCKKLPLVVLIDEGSASASEIFSGAIQDNDRGLIVGRRSFGKGLVQQPFEFTDGSAMRLTIARYYTPSGRCIQRPYENGHDQNYEMDWLTRYQHGEFFSKDSIKLNEDLKFKTRLGRTVYGGGGIMPDVFVPQDTIGTSSYLTNVIRKGLILRYTFEYTDKNRELLSNFTDQEKLLIFLKKQNLVNKFVRYASKNGVKRRNILIYKSYKLLQKNIYAGIIYNMLDKEAYIKYLNSSDDTVEKAIELITSGKSVPTAMNEGKDSNNEQERTEKTNQKR